MEIELTLSQCQAAKLARLSRTSGKSAASVALSFLSRGVRHPRRSFLRPEVSATHKKGDPK